MPAVVRRHWGVAVAMVLMGLAAAGWLLFSRSSSAQEALAPAAPGAPKLDPNTAARVQQLRERLMLENQDLAALGCGQAAAEDLLRALGGWCESNRVALEQAELEQARARNALAEAWRRVNVGPKDEALLRQIPTLREALAASVQRQRELEQRAIPAVAAQLNALQNTMWGSARANGRVPERYRFAPNLKREQMQQLAKLDPADGQLAGREASVLSAEQKLAVETAAANRQASLAGVCAAEQSVLPRPEPLMAVDPMGDPATMPPAAQ